MVNIQPIKSKLHLDVLTIDQVAEIRSATLHILETVGVHFPSERALRVFSEHGAEVDRENQIVRLRFASIQFRKLPITVQGAPQSIQFVEQITPISLPLIRDPLGNHAFHHKSALRWVTTGRERLMA